MDFLGYELPTVKKLMIEKLTLLAARDGMQVFLLGAYAGFTALTMLPHIAARGGRLHIVDWFRGNPTASGPCETESYLSDKVISALLANIREGSFQDSVDIFIGTTADMGSLVRPGIADLVYIAADHRYSHIRRDIVDWLPVVRLNGLMGGHAFDARVNPGTPEWEAVLAHCEVDYYDKHYGVIRAVTETFADFNYEPGTDIWWARKTVA